MKSVWSSCFAHNASGRPSALRFEPPVASLGPLRPSTYYLVPFTVWHPVRCFADSVPYAPCPKGEAGTLCQAKTTLKSFGSPRWVIGLNRSELLWCTVHQCPAHGSFSSTDERCVDRLPGFIKTQFNFVLTQRSAVTLE
jgi:hypothetical protein